MFALKLKPSSWPGVDKFVKEWREIANFKMSFSIDSTWFNQEIIKIHIPVFFFCWWWYKFTHIGKVSNLFLMWEQQRDWKWKGKEGKNCTVCSLGTMWPLTELKQNLTLNSYRFTIFLKRSTLFTAKGTWPMWVAKVAHWNPPFTPLPSTFLKRDCHYTQTTSR